MCGIAGLVDLAGISRAGVAPRLLRAVERLNPRGPDGHGTWTDSRAAFAHTRLAVIDLSEAAAQPMAGHGRVITFNGEIYNFAALRAELTARGTVFTSRSDTEVLLAGWDAWGPALLDRLVGMFAFALWDARAGELVLVRDRFGKKPLVYRRETGRLAFASDLVAVGALCDVAPVLDPTALRLLFALSYIPEPWTIDRATRKLPAGHMATFSARGFDVRKWYRSPPRRPYTDEAAAARDLVTIFDDAVESRLVADVPVGAFLSGGIDSALVAAAVAARGRRLCTFTVGFPGAADYYEERPAARAVANYLGHSHTEIAIVPDQVTDLVEQVLDGFDEPFADSSAIPTYLLARATRRHVTVALSGDGADEVFGGYRKYQGELRAERYRRLPRWLRSGVIEPLAALLPESKDTPWRERARRLRRFAAHAGKHRVERHAAWASALTESELVALFPEWAAPAATSVEAIVADLYAATDPDDAVNAVLDVDVGLVLSGDMLVKVDRMSMAHGLEVRCPFLDHRVVECARAMPGVFKLQPGAGKAILRRAFAERLPPEVFRRPKKGFEVPIARWLVGELRDLTRRAIDPARLARQGLFRPEVPQRWFTDLECGRRDTAAALWTLVAFQAWAERRWPSPSLEAV